MTTIRLVLKAWLSSSPTLAEAPIWDLGKTPIDTIGNEEELGPASGSSYSRGLGKILVQLTHG